MGESKMENIAQNQIHESDSGFIPRTDVYSTSDKSKAQKLTTAENQWFCEFWEW